VHRGASLAAELLEVEGQHADGTGNVARELLQACRFLQIDEGEFIQAEVVVAECSPPPGWDPKAWKRARPSASRTISPGLSRIVVVID
jgi:hypothetical protein